jgi:two-component system chemotaxis sensor kinase CheA
MEPRDPEYQRLWQIFREECREHIQKLNEGLLTLERQPSEAPLDESLRSAHSLKGASRMMGLKTMETLAHTLETLLTQLVRGEKKVAPPIIAALYQGVDAVSHAIGSLEQGKEPQGIDEVLDKIRVGVQEKTPPGVVPPDPHPDTSPKSSLAPGMAQAPSRRESSALTTIRVQTYKLDTLLNQAGELLVSKIEAVDNLRHIEEILDLLEEGRRKHAPLVNWADNLEEELYSTLRRLSEDTRRLERLVDGIHEGVRDLRLLPLSTILDPFPRMVRDLSQNLGKEVELILEGTSVRLDKKILEELRDPLIHLIRNSIDHGAESPDERAAKGKPRKGRIWISGRQEGGKVLISVQDDGKGLDRQAIERTAVQKGLASAQEIRQWRDEEVWELIFRTGFSTAPDITEVSGRGIGLDVVLSSVEGLKGSITTASKPGEGTTFTLALPLTLSTIHALLFRTGGDIYCLPTDSVEKIVLLSRDQISSAQGKATAVVDGVPLAFAWLAQVLKLAKEEAETGTITALLLRGPRGKALLGVDALLSEEEVVVKGIGKLASQIPILSGGTILGRGEVALILNANHLLRSLAHSGKARPIFPRPASPSLPLKKKRALVAEDSLTTRTLERNILEAAGFDVTTAVDGEDALIKLHEKSFDIVITDVQMPRLDGLALTSRIKKDERFKNIPVILVTALQTEADKRRGIEVGADAYLTKATFDQKHLLEIVQRFV